MRKPYERQLEEIIHTTNVQILRVFLKSTLNITAFEIAFFFQWSIAWYQQRPLGRHGSFNCDDSLLFFLRNGRLVIIAECPQFSTHTSPGSTSHSVPPIFSRYYHYYFPGTQTALPCTAATPSHCYNYYYEHANCLSRGTPCIILMD